MPEGGSSTASTPRSYGSQRRTSTTVATYVESATARITTAFRARTSRPTACSSGIVGSVRDGWEASDGASVTNPLLGQRAAFGLPPLRGGGPLRAGLSDRRGFGAWERRTSRASSCPGMSRGSCAVRRARDRCVVVVSSGSAGAVVARASSTRARRSSSSRPPGLTSTPRSTIRCASLMTRATRTHPRR